jgi:hypothetical protein
VIEPERIPVAEISIEQLCCLAAVERGMDPDEAAKHLEAEREPEAAPVTVEAKSEPAFPWDAIQVDGRPSNLPTPLSSFAAFGEREEQPIMKSADEEIEERAVNLRLSDEGRKLTKSQARAQVMREDPELGQRALDDRDEANRAGRGEEHAKSVAGVQRRTATLERSGHNRLEHAFATAEAAQAALASKIDDLAGKGPGSSLTPEQAWLAIDADAKRLVAKAATRGESLPLSKARVFVMETNPDLATKASQ